MALDFAQSLPGLACLDQAAPCLDPSGDQAGDQAGDPSRALAWLQSGRLDEGMREALRCRAGTGAARDPLLRRLRENPFLKTAVSPPYGYEGDPAVIDLALGLGPLPADTTPLGVAMYCWMAAQSTTFAAYQARRKYVATRLDCAADFHPGALAVGLFGGHGRELPLSRAWRERRLSVQLVDFDVRVLERAQRENSEWGALSTRPGSLAEILAGRFTLRDCGLVYLPLAGEYLPDDTLARLLESLVPALRPFGEIVLPAFTRLPEQGLLEWAGDWQPNTRGVAQLLHLARGLDDVTALVHEDPVLGVAYLHLERRPRTGAPRSPFAAQ